MSGNINIRHIDFCCTLKHEVSWGTKKKFFYREICSIELIMKVMVLKNNSLNGSLL